MMLDDGNSRNSNSQVSVGTCSYNGGVSRGNSGRSDRALQDDCVLCQSYFNSCSAGVLRAED